MRQSFYSLMSSSVAAVAFTAMSVGAPVMAQTSASPNQSAALPTMENEIVVTTRLREERLQDVPVSLVAFSEDTIERQRIETLDRLSFLVPSLAVSDPFGRNNPSIAMRGIGLAGIGDELPVGIFIDGIYLTGRSSANLLLTDLERIEVARGPQSALFGRNTFAGAINFITKRPGNELDAFVQGTVGDKDRYEVRVGISVPLIADKLGLHVGFIHRDWGGFYENTNSDGPPLNRQRTTSGNIAVSAQLSDNFDASLRVIYSEDRDSTAAAFLVPANIAPNLLNGGSLGFFQGIAPNSPPADSPSGPCCAASEGVEGFKRDTIRVALTMNYQLNDSLTFTSLTGFNSEDQLYDQDVDYIAEKLFTFGNIIKRDDLSQELRLSYSDDRLKLLAGAFYFEFNNRFTNRGYAQFFLPPALRSDNPVRNNGPFTSIAKTKAYAVFGSAAYTFNTFTLTADLRWNSENKTFDYFRGAAFIPDPTRERTWNSFTPRFIADWKPSEDVMLYASAAKGFKTGGFNDQINIFENERVFDPETNWTYELGTKLALFDRKLFFNLTGFYVDWTDQQVSVASGAGPANNTIIANAARSTSKGFELEVTARPTRRLELSGAVALADARFDEYIDPALAGLNIVTNQIEALPGLPLVQLPNGVFGADVSGNRLPRASKWQATASAQYLIPITALGAENIVTRADYMYRSSQCAEPSNLACTPNQNRVNLRIGLEGPRYDLSLWVDNVFDERTPSVLIRFSDFNSFFNPPVGRLTRAFQVTPADGRTVGATVRVKFGG
jgi:iron complex outermembrane receptor protein